MKIAVPSMAPGGLDVPISGHFGKSETFTIVTVEDKKITGTEIIQNPPHVHGGCMAPVNLLKENGADIIIVSGLGMRPMQGFQQVGIQVYAGAAGTVGFVVEEYLAGNLKPAGNEVICQH